MDGGGELPSVRLLSIGLGHVFWQLTIGKQRLELRQDLNDQVNVYASYNRGFKAGLWALQSPAGPPVPNCG